MAPINKLLLTINVSVTGTAAEATREAEESLWNTYDARRSGRTFASSFSTERTTGETKSIGKFHQTTSWHADSSSSRERVTLDSLKPTSESLDEDEEEEEKIEMNRNIEAMYRTGKNDTGKVKISNENATVFSRSMNDTRQKINLSTSRTFIQSTPERWSFNANIISPASFDNVSRIMFLLLTLRLLDYRCYVTCTTRGRTKRSGFTVRCRYKAIENEGTNEISSDKRIKREIIYIILM